MTHGIDHNQMSNKTPPFVSGALPLLGHALEFRNDTDGLDRRGHAEHGDVYAIKLGGRNVAVITGAEYNRLFYLETDRSLNISDAYSFLRAAFGEVLFIAPHERYQNQRPILRAIFGRSQMARYAVAMQAEVQHWLDGLGEVGSIDIAAEMLTLTQQVAGHAFIGPTFREELGDDFWQAYEHISASLDPLLPPNLPLPKFVRRDRARQRIHAQLTEVLAERRRHPGRYDDLLTQLLELPQSDGALLNDDEIIRLFMGLLFAGHETTAGQAAWTVIQLLQHPEYLCRVQAEIDERVPPGMALDGGTLRLLEHIYWAIDETTRLKPSAPMQIRIVEEPLEVGEYRVPAGWLLRVNAANSHHQPEVFTGPDRYDPLRFSAERAEGSSFDIVGFGGGVHKCTGMNFAKNEIAILVALLFQQFELELLTPAPTVVTGQGASRPSATLVRYCRRREHEPVEQLAAPIGSARP